MFVQLPCPSPVNSIKYSFYAHFQYRTEKTCRNENSTLFLTIAILSSYERLLVYLPSILDSWILTATVEIEIIIFLEEKYVKTEAFIEKVFLQLNKDTNQQIKSCLYIVKLKHVENDYPPQKKSFYAMKFIYAFYRQRTSWLLRVDDNAYVNIERIIKLLKSIDHRKLLYIGQSGSGRKNGLPIYFPANQYFCMGGSGIILSQSTLVKLGPWLDYYLNNEKRTKHEDVELGRCILNHVHISCSNFDRSEYFFYHHYGPRYLFGHDFTPSIISRALTIHPIKDRNTFQQIFAFYIKQKQKQKQKQRQRSISNSNSLSFKIFNRQDYVTVISFDLIRDSHYQNIDLRWRIYLEDLIRSYVQKTRTIWYQLESNWTLTSGQLVYGYHRMIPSYGIEVLAEILLKIHTTSRSPTHPGVLQKRLHIYQPFLDKRRLDYREIDNIETNENIHQLNLIVVSSNKDEALKRFFHNFKREVLDHPVRHTHFTLTVLYFFQKQTNHLIIDTIRHLSVKHRSIIRVSVADAEKISYNRGLGRQLASNLFSSHQMLFFLDVDLVFTGQALDNARRLMIHQSSISSCTVYFPIVFSIFSKKFVVNDSQTIDINSKNGLFSIHGFGNVVVRKLELDKIGGWETDNHDWGMEDVNLFERFSSRSSECYVFRAVEPGLRHHYHEKMCKDITNRARQSMCLTGNAILLGSQLDMTNRLLNNHTFNNF